MNGYLVVEEGPLAGQIIRLEDATEWIIGRDHDVCHSVLEDPMVSRKHVMCQLTDDGFLIENLSATNPAQVNGIALEEPVLLEEGDMVQIGSILLKFTEEDPAYSPIQESYTEEEEEDTPTIFDEEESVDLFSFSEDTASRFVLKITSGPNLGAEFNISPGTSYVLGKDPTTCDIIFQDLSVSKEHGKISCSEDNIASIEDLGSKNGIYINGKKLEEITPLHSQDIITFGTTVFVFVDKESVSETIVSPPPTPSYSEEEAEAEEVLAGKKSWKEMLIPTKHLVVAGSLLVIVLACFIGTISLFKTKPVTLATKDNNRVIEETLEQFPGVNYQYNSGSGKLFLMGNVVTQIEKDELLYLLKAKSFVTSIDNNVIIDEMTAESFNALLIKNANWRGVSVSVKDPGKYVIHGYLQSIDDATSLSEYLTYNFPYLDQLSDHVVVENTLTTEIQSILNDRGLVNVTFQISNGDIILAGRVNTKLKDTYDDTMGRIRRLEGIKQIKNFVVITTASTARIDLTSKFQVSGNSMHGKSTQFVVISGNILGVGDDLDGMTVTGLKNNVIFLEKDGLKFKINYNQQ